MTAYVNMINRPKTPDFDAAWRAVGQAGWELGDHTARHCHFGQTCEGLTRFDAAAEMDENQDFIIKVLGAPGVWTLAYPFGDLGYEAEAPRHVFLARGVSPGTIDPHAGDPFNLPIYGAKAGDTAVAFNAALDAARGRGHWLIYMFHSILPTKAAWYAPVESHEIVATVNHAKAFGDLWLDTVLNIGAYWRGETLVEAAIAGAPAAAKPITWTWTLPPRFPPGHRLRVTVDGGVLSQAGRVLAWNPRGYYEIDLDAGSLSWRPE
jgi:peptidoglycan/xylan/chitin deacetylase (PgdA/CDA1 family)